MIQKQEEHKPEFEYLTEQFDDIRILRYQVPAFESLTLREKYLFTT